MMSQWDKKIFAKFPKKDEQKILKLFKKYGKINVIKKIKSKNKCFIIIEFNNIKFEKSIIKDKDTIYQEKGWFIDYYKEKKLINEKNKAIKKEDESEDQEKKKMKMNPKKKRNKIQNKKKNQKKIKKKKLEVV